MMKWQIILAFKMHLSGFFYFYFTYRAIKTLATPRIKCFCKKNQTKKCMVPTVLFIMMQWILIYKKFILTYKILTQYILPMSLNCNSLVLLSNLFNISLNKTFRKMEAILLYKRHGIDDKPIDSAYYVWCQWISLDWITRFLCHVNLSEQIKLHASFALQPLKPQSPKYK